MAFLELQERLVNYLGEQFSGNNNLSHYKFLLNLAMQDLAEETDWNFLRRRSSLRLMAPYAIGVIGVTNAGPNLVPGGATFGYNMIGSFVKIEDGIDEAYEITGYDGTNLQIVPNYPSDTVALYDTGTVTATAGSATVTGAATVWTSAMEGRYFHIAGDEDRYAIAEVVSNTELRLEKAYGGTGGAGLSYSIGLAFTLIKSHYRIPMYIGHISSAWIRDGRIVLSGTHPHLQDFIDPDDQSVGKPTEMRIVGHTSKALYATGTVAVTGGSTTLTFAGATLDDYFAGLDFRVEGDDRHYVIESVNTVAGTAVLSEAYRGTTAATASYEIQPRGTPEVRFDQFPPGDDYMIEYRYTTRHPWLIGDEEYPLFPPTLYPLIYHRAHLEFLIQENESGDKIAVAHQRVKSLLDRGKATHRMLHNKFMYGIPSLPVRGHRRVNPGLLSRGPWGW
jgi:hypothetical protein